MAYTQQQIDTLKAAIAEGALTVRYADKQVTYRSLDEMIRILSIMEREVNTTDVETASGIVYGSFSKGLSVP